MNLYGTGASNLVNASIGIQHGNMWSVAVWGSNILNDKHMTAGAASSDILTGSGTAARAGLPDRPAFGLRVKYSYN